MDLNINNLSSFVTLLAALSVASERLVEIVKGFFGFLSTENTDPAQERRRKTYLQILALLAGLLTAWLTKDVNAVKALIPDTQLAWIPLGLLASGGSGFWNSIQTYLAKAKELKKAEVENKKAQTVALQQPPPAGGQ
jgi:phosphatidylglycerophosphate synthase